MAGRRQSSLVTARCRRCSVTAGSSSSAAVVEAVARSRRSSAPEQTRDGRPSKGELRRAARSSPPQRAALNADVDDTEDSRIERI